MSTTVAPQANSSRAKYALSLGALGVVFGDIGTSPLYALRESLHQLPPEARSAGILGLLSLIFWSLVIVVGLKYITLVMRADNQGEGGIFALLALGGLETRRGPSRGIGAGVMVALIGAAMICGEGVITPAISVLSASEGLRLLVPEAGDYVIPLCLATLLGLFAVQKRGTKAIGQLFGPVMLVWFVSLGLLGLWHVTHDPSVLRALHPGHAVGVLLNHPGCAAGILGSVVLAITGVEALYADMGHFGRPAILRAWYGLVLPGLTLNYFGQGSYALAHPEALDNPFLSLAPDGPLRAALLVLSLLAAVIASQALISGTFSLVRQAIQLGYVPRLKILHTNADQRGQIYLPLVNFLLAAGSILTVLLFKSSSSLAAAYGIAVTATMAVTSFSLFFVARRRWGWGLPVSLSVCVAFGLVDLIFLGANVHKFTEGGWLPVTIAAGLLAVMHTWKSGRLEIQDKIYGGAVNELELSSIARSKNIVRMPGSAVFMVATPHGTPLALLHHLRANRCLQRTVVLLTILTEERPAVDDEERMTLEHLGEGVWRSVVRYGYMESPDVAKMVDRIKSQGVPLNPAATTFYFNREMIITGGSARMAEWQKGLYAFLSRNASPIKDYYRILPTQIIEIGLPVQL